LAIPTLSDTLSFQFRIPIRLEISFLDACLFPHLDRRSVLYDSFPRSRFPSAKDLFALFWGLLSWLYRRWTVFGAGSFLTHNFGDLDVFPRFPLPMLDPGRPPQKRACLSVGCFSFRLHLRSNKIGDHLPRFSRPHSCS